MDKKERKRKYDINFDFLNQWSEDLAYILGFTMADGCISDNRLSYGVQVKDIELLEFIRDKICPTRPILFNNQYRNQTLCRSARLKIGSQKLCRLLLDYNIFPRKTGHEQLPVIPEQFHKDYLRGLFDGDGDVGISNHKNKQLSFKIVSANQEFLIDVKNILGCGYGYVHPKDGNCFAWYIYKQEHIRNIYNYIYNTNSFYLQRKLDKFLEGKICQNAV